MVCDRDTHPAQCLVDDPFNTFVSYYIVAQPYLQNFVIGDGRSHDVEDIGQGGQTDFPEVLT
jgi:hypothetical protein